jgi:serine/threonine protein kinase
MVFDTFPTVRGELETRYRIDRELGRGGMATVYLAHDLRHERPVAIKVLADPISVGAEDERFRREIRIAAQLSHPHILSLHDSGEAGGHRYYVMPFVSGESLRDRLTREKQLPIDDALTIVREVAEALDYAHRTGIVHRDIKPENILLHEGHAIVADFGIARAATQGETSTLTQAGQMIGTPAYLSPEQITGAELDGRSDVYSLGCVLYECLTGEVPFGGSAIAMLAQRLTSPPPSPSAKRSGVTATVDQAVRTAMATASSARFRSGHEFAAALSASVAPRMASDRRAIVVLPFANRSPDADNEYFSDGLTEEIISDLASIKALSVISRTSAMRLKGTDKDVRTIGRELGVRYVLEGSVRRAGSSLRITAQLIDAENDVQLWSEKYGGTMDDVFEVQERVAREIVKALGVSLSSDEDRRLAHRSIEDVRAFELYLEARQELRRLGVATERGKALLERAIAIEGRTAPLLGLLAWANVAMVKAGIAHPAILDESERQADEVLAMAPDAPYGHAVRGYIAHERGQLLEAVRHYNAALEREPNDADSLFWLSISYANSACFEEADATAARLIASDPLSSMAWLASGVAKWFPGRWAESAPIIRRGLDLDPQNFIIRWCLGYVYALMGEVALAAEQAAWLVEHGPQVPYTLHLQSVVQSLQGDRAGALAAVSTVNTAPLDYHLTFHMSESFAMAGEIDRALAVLEEGVDKGFLPHAFIATYCPFMAPLRGLPDFDRIVEKARQRADQFKRSLAEG